MPAIVLQNLAGATISYNGVQFGGADSDYRSTPPQYRFRGEFVYDDSGRAVKHTRYTLSVSSIFYEASEAALANNMASIEQRLSVAGKALRILGLGSAFGSSAASGIVDEEWGPKPLSIECIPLGQLAWECNWTVEFSIKQCGSQLHNGNPLAFSAFSFDTTWQNDFEGLCTRTISGHVEIAIHRNVNTPKVPQHIVDEVKDSITVIVPEGFRRVNNVWRENASKNRLDFVIVDEAMGGDPLPVGCSSAEGSLSYASMGPGFNKAQVTLSMDVKVAPGYPPAIGGQIFLAAVQAKQQSMQAGLAGNNKAVVVPQSLNITAGKFNRSRETSGTASWLITKCLGSMMTAAGIWQPLVGTNYQQWRASIAHLWNNRGVTLNNGQPLRSQVTESVVVDLCDNVSSVTLGSSAVAGQSPTLAPTFSFSCPNIPEDGGWITYDLRVRIMRDDPQTWHRKAVSYTPQQGSGTYTPGGITGTKVPLGGPVYSQDTTTQHDVEYHGLPVVNVLLQFRALRLLRQPAMPELLNVAGQTAYFVGQQIDGPRVAFDSVCPVWFIRGWKHYRINGYVPSVSAVQSETSCAAPTPSQNP